MKHRFYALALSLASSISAHADFKPQPSDYISIGDINKDGVADIAAFIWEDKCLLISKSQGFGIIIVDVSIADSDLIPGSIFECASVDEQRHKFYSPTVLIYSGKTGDIINYIEFFDETCPYSPVSITAHKNTIALTVQVGSSIEFGDSQDDPYPDCQYKSGNTSILAETRNLKTLTETRNLRTGKLIKQIPLQDFETFAFP